MSQSNSKSEVLCLTTNYHQSPIELVIVKTIVWHPESLLEVGKVSVVVLVIASNDHVRHLLLFNILINKNIMLL